MKSIVVGSDGTERSGAAIGMAVELAEGMGAALHLVTAYSVPVASMGYEGMAMVSYPETEKSIEDTLEAQAAPVRRRGIDVTTHAKPGGAADVLCHVATEVGADVIVVGNRRMKGSGRLLGSVPNRVAHHAPCSVFIAHTT